MKQDETKIYLTSEEFKKVLDQEKGHGTDGVVFKYNKDYLIKLYRKSFFKQPSELLGSNDDSDMKVFHKGDIKFAPTEQKNINFYVRDGQESSVKINMDQAMSEIVKKQRKVIKTELPKKLVYVDGRFVGVLLKKVNGIQVHKLTGAPLEYKKKVMNVVLDALKELYDNNIYHTDINNSPRAKVTYEKGTDTINSYGHSHILLNPFTMKVNIIDLDGKSTTYTNFRDELLEKKSLESLSLLILEFLYEVDLFEEEQLEDTDVITQDNMQQHIAKVVESHGVSPELAEKLAYRNLDSLDEAREIVNKTR